MLNDALRLVRVFHDLSSTEAAHALGISKSFLSEIENGKKKVTLDTLQKYSDTFEIPISSLMFFAENMEKDRTSEKARTYIAGKTVKMLEWIATISKKETA